MPLIGIYLLSVFFRQIWRMSNLSFIIKAILEIEGDTLFVNLLVCLVVDSHILDVDIAEARCCLVCLQCTF